MNALRFRFFNANTLSFTSNRGQQGQMERKNKETKTNNRHRGCSAL